MSPRALLSFARDEWRWFRISPLAYVLLGAVVLACWALRPWVCPRIETRPVVDPIEPTTQPLTSDSLAFVALCLVMLAAVIALGLSNNLPCGA